MKTGYWLAAVVLATGCLSYSRAAELSDVEFIRRTVPAVAPVVAEVNRAVWDYAEIRWHEVKSSAKMIEVARNAGFTIETPVADMPTAFIARYGKGKPIIAILGEYDCLPNLSQEAGNPVRAPIPGKSAGHGCGHSALGAGSLGAALLVKEYLRETGRPGTVLFYGTPAEESGSGKVFMVRAGLFKNVDAALLWHPYDRNDASALRSLANRRIEFSFTGIASHAAGAPEKGRSAVDACELLNIGVNYMREHLIQEARLHFAYLNSGGSAANVVPEKASLYYYVRAPRMAQVEDISARVIDVAKGAALMSGTKLEYRIVGGLYDFIPNPTVSQMLSDALCELGGPDFDANDQKIARPFYAAAGDEQKATLRAEIAAFDPEAAATLDSKPLSRAVIANKPGMPTALRAISFDAGDVSYVVPTAQCYIATGCVGTALHSWQMTAQVGTTIGDKAATAAARAIALTCIRLYNNPDALVRAKKELEAATGGHYECSFPASLMPGAED